MEIPFFRSGWVDVHAVLFVLHQISTQYPLNICVDISMNEIRSYSAVRSI